MYFRCLLLLLLHFPSAAQPLPTLIPTTNGTLWGYADTTGKVVIPLQWGEASFFQEGKARVQVSNAGDFRNTKIYALINEAGRYIIPPAAGWTGTWAGSWSAPPFNAIDSAGRRGLVDTNGTFLIPPVWEGITAMAPPLSDSFRIVTQNGLAGILSRSGGLVVEPKWGEISSTPEFAQIGAFLVRDWDNMEGRNSWGVASMQNRLLVPPRYAQLELKKTKEGKVVIAGKRMLQNQVENNYGNQNEMRPLRYLDPATGSILPLTEADFEAPDYNKHTLAGGYTVRNPKRSLEDSTGKTIVAAHFWKMEGDTVFLMETKWLGEDSLFQKVSFLSLKTGKPLLPPHTQLLYATKPRNTLSQGGFLEGHGNRYPETQHYKIPLPYAGETEWFYKDSLLYQVTGWASGSGGTYYTVRGDRHGGRTQNYYAVVNAKLDYVLGPQQEWKIESYDPAFGLAIASTAGAYGSAETRYTLLDTAARQKITPQKSEILRGFLWKEKAYAFLKVADPCNVEGKAQVFLIDGRGNAVPAFSGLEVLPYKSGIYNPFISGFGVQTDGRSVVWAQDSAGRQGIFYPDGTPVYSALNFKYKELNPTVNYWFLGSAGTHFRMLIDTSNKVVLPGLFVHSVSLAQDFPFREATKRENSKLLIGGLFSAHTLVPNTEKAPQFFTLYIDYRGKVYYTPPATP